MFAELARATGGHGWAIASMLFFIAVFAVVVWRVMSGSRETYERYSHLPLDNPDAPPSSQSDATQG